MGKHADDLELELARTGEADEDTLRHVEACEICRDRLAAHRKLLARLAVPLEPLDVPAELDQVLLRTARERSAAVRRILHERRRPSILRRVVPWAAAAGLAAAVGIWLAVRAPGPGPSRSPDPPPLSSRPLHLSPSGPQQPDTQATAVRFAPQPDDLNADGRIDVLDAYLVALAADRGEDSAALDRNGDGRVDRRDAERLVMAAVTLPREGEGTTR